MVRKDYIDTSTESVDEILMNEMEAQLKVILQEELSFKTAKTKKSVEEEIIEYVKTKSLSISTSISEDEQ
jgi:hypothetical protein